jgi:hypothetical protein
MAPRRGTARREDEEDEDKLDEPAFTRRQTRRMVEATESIAESLFDIKEYLTEGGFVNDLAEALANVDDDD